MIRGIGHLALDVINMDQSIHFYCNVLRFKQAFEIENDKGEPWIVYIKIAERQFIELFYGGSNRPEDVPDPVGFSHLCLEVEDIQEIASHLRSHNIPLDVEPMQGKDSNWQCWAKDPDGNRIEFMQLNPNSPQMTS